MEHTKDRQRSSSCWPRPKLYEMFILIVVFPARQRIDLESIAASFPPTPLDL